MTQMSPRATLGYRPPVGSSESSDTTSAWSEPSRRIIDDSPVEKCLVWKM